MVCPFILLPDFYTCNTYSHADMATASGNCSTGEIRLIDSNGVRQENAGRLEVCINNAWGTVCDVLFDDVDTNVVCSQLGIAPGGELCPYRVLSMLIAGHITSDQSDARKSAL